MPRKYSAEFKEKAVHQTLSQEVFRWCMRYNTRRRHSWCNLVAPDVFEAETSATLTKAA